LTRLLASDQSQPWGTISRKTGLLIGTVFVERGREVSVLSVEPTAIHTALSLCRTSRNGHRRSEWPGRNAAQGGSLVEPNL